MMKSFFHHLFYQVNTNFVLDQSVVIKYRLSLQFVIFYCILQIGLFIFAFGFYVNIDSDRRLRGLRSKDRKPGEYKIPIGG